MWIACGVRSRCGVKINESGSKQFAGHGAINHFQIEAHVPRHRRESVNIDVLNRTHETWQRRGAPAPRHFYAVHCSATAVAAVAVSPFRLGPRACARARVRSVDMVEIKSFERLLQRLRDDRAHNGCIVCFGSNRNLRDSRARSVTKHVVYIERVNRTHTVHCISHRICMSDRNNAPLPPIGGRGRGRARKPLRNIYTIHPLRPI